MTREMTDYHCHLLPAIDDGASGQDESVEMARILSSFGFSTVYCTPHRIRGCYDNDPQRIASLTQIMQGVLDGEGIPLRLVPGCEQYFDEFLAESLPGAETIGVAKSVLVELPFKAGPELLAPMTSLFAQSGLTPLVAHPERCRAFEPAAREQGGLGALSLLFGKRAPVGLEGSEVLALKDRGCRFQANLGSFAGVYGKQVKERALLFLRSGVYSCLGSDAHRSEGLEEMLTLGLAAVVAEVGEEAANYLLGGLPG